MGEHNIFVRPRLRVPIYRYTTVLYTIGGNSIESLECSCLSTLKLFAQFIVNVVKQRLFVLDAATAIIYNDEGRTKEEDKTEKA